MLTNNRFLSLLWVAALFGSVLLLAGCGGNKQPPTTHADLGPLVLPISNPCATERPKTVETLKNQMTEAQWLALTHRQRVAAIGRQAMAYSRFALAERSATAACPEVDGE